MANFKNLSEGEKFAWSKDFLIKFRIMQKLRPELTEERDILTLVAKKFYGEKIEELEECVNFIESKTAISSLADVNLGPAVEEYENGLKEKCKETEEQFKQDQKAEEEKMLEYERQTRLRNYFDKLYKDEEIRQQRSERTKSILKLSLVAAIVLAVIGMGGIVGVANALLAFISNLSSIQAVTIGLVVVAGWNKGWLKNLKGKFTARGKANKDKREKKLEDLKKDQESHEEEQKKVMDDCVKARAGREESEKTARKAKHEFESECAHLSKYNKMNEFDRTLKMSEVEIKNQFEHALRQYDSDDEKKNLDKWREHFTASLYYGAFKGTLKNRADVDALVESSRQKFEQLSNPLNVNRTFTEGNVRAQTNLGANKPIEELFESI